MDMFTRILHRYPWVGLVPSHPHPCSRLKVMLLLARMLLPDDSWELVTFLQKFPQLKKLPHPKSYIPKGMCIQWLGSPAKTNLKNYLTFRVPCWLHQNVITAQHPNFSSWLMLMLLLPPQMLILGALPNELPVQSSVSELAPRGTMPNNMLQAKTDGHH